MSHARKHVKDAYYEYPEPKEGQCVARVTEPRGSNICEIETQQGASVLVLIPTKFHKILYLKKGDFVIVELEQDVSKYSGKVVGAIVCPLHQHQIEHLAEMDKWPAVWSDAVKGSASNGRESRAYASDMMPPSDSEEDEDILLSHNPNRAAAWQDSSSSSEE